MGMALFAMNSDPSQRGEGVFRSLLSLLRLKKKQCLQRFPVDTVETVVTLHACLLSKSASTLDSSLNEFTKKEPSHNIP